MAIKCFYEEIKNMNVNQDEDSFFKEFQEIMRMLIMSIYNVSIEY